MKQKAKKSCPVKKPTEFAINSFLYNMQVAQIALKNEFEDKNIIIESGYPHNYFNLKSPSLDYKTKCASFIQTITKDKPNHPYFLDLKVLYIGQSYGIEGARTAPDRLKSHSTLQTIYSDVMSNNPDKEVWLFLMSFRQMGIMKFDGITEFSATERKGDNIRTSAFLEKMRFGGITEQQFINFTEAALIRYFQPEYNIKFKNSFPNPAHSTYSEC